MERCIDLLGGITAVSVVLLVTLGVWNVGGRFIGKYSSMSLSSPTLIDAQQYAFVITFLLGIPYTLLKGKHSKIDLLLKEKESRNTKILTLVCYIVLSLPFCLITIYFSIRFFWDAWVILEQSSSGGLPRYPLKFMIIACFLFVLFAGLTGLLRPSFKSQDKDKDVSK